ncbi:PDR/VanB family oxidoreductase [Rhodococcus olei]|uniref:PDR/VanB family oxidoreductase n=1 Tax=Rhodococcus olei TaxID=2161675 RepID=A0ABP8NYA6_9NOCA
MFRMRVARRALVADGVLELVLLPVDGERVPEWTPGAHVGLTLGEGLVRHYSLCGEPTDDHFRLAILREPESRGGSVFVHDSLAEGDVLTVEAPRNHFPLVPDAPEYVFVAGGIGVTPLLPMIEEVERVGATWRLEYGGRTRASMAYHEELTTRYPSRVRVHPQDEVGLMPLAEILADRDRGVAVYCCGPGPLIEAVEKECGAQGIGDLHFERFSAQAPVALDTDCEFEVVLAVSGQTVPVPVGCTILEAVEKAGVPADSSCRDGTCGTCEVGVLEGRPDHRDFILTDAEKETGDTMLICISRSCSDRLVLDL